MLAMTILTSTMFSFECDCTVLFWIQAHKMIDCTVLRDDSCIRVIVATAKKKTANASQYYKKYTYKTQPLRFQLLTQFFYSSILYEFIPSPILHYSIFQ